MLAKVFGWIVGAPRVSSMEDGECRSGRNVDSIHFLVLLSSWICRGKRCDTPLSLFPMSSPHFPLSFSSLNLLAYVLLLCLYFSNIKKLKHADGISTEPLVAPIKKLLVFTVAAHFILEFGWHSTYVVRGKGGNAFFSSHFLSFALSRVEGFIMSALN